MYERELKRVKQRILKNIKTKRLKERNIFLFGVSDNTRQIIQILREQGITPKNIIDNDITKQKSYCGGIEVIDVFEILHPQEEVNVYFIYSAYWREMVEQLYAMNIKDKNIVLLYQKPGGISKLLMDTCYGKYLYRRIIQEYGNVPVFICPYTGTGDIYLIGTFWEQYLEKEDITDYVFIVITGACKKVAQLCNIKNIHLVKEKRHVSKILNYYMLCPEETQIKVLNDSWGQIHTNQIEWFRGYKNLYFTKLFRHYVFDLPEDTQPIRPIFKDVSVEIEKLFQKYGLQKGNTIILSPYSNTLSDLPISFWKKIAQTLKQRGYIVCTNSCGISEPPIDGTIPIFFPLTVAPQMIEQAGYFIGVRSGFCDVISSSKAKKIILYDLDNRFYNVSAFDYFSLVKMGLCEEAIEIEYKISESALLIEKIFNLF